MPFVFLAIALLFIVLGARGQARAAGKMFAAEFTGKNSFIQWFLAIVLLGGVGYYKPVRPVADAMLGLVIVALLLTKGNPKAPGGGFFAQLESAFQTATPTPQQSVTQQAQSNATASSTGAGLNLLAPPVSAGSSAFLPNQPSFGLPPTISQSVYPGGLTIPQNPLSVFP